MSIEIPNISKELEEKEPQEIGRFELESNQKIDIVIRKMPGAELPIELETAGCEAVQVVLQKNGKNFFNFKDLSSKETNFVLRNKNEEKTRGSSCIWGQASFGEFDAISVPRIWQGKAKDVLALLHEISHSLDPNSERRDKKMFYLRDGLEEMLKWNVKNEHGKELKALTAEYLKLMSQRERFAWAKALSIAKKLKKEQGIDALKPFQGKTPLDTRKNLEEYIHGMKSLGYYEMLYVTRTELGEELKGIFTTKIYKGEKFTPEHRKRIRK